MELTGHFIPVGLSNQSLRQFHEICMFVLATFDIIIQHIYA